MPSTKDDWDDFAGGLGSTPAPQQPANRASAIPSSQRSPNQNIDRYADSGCPICHQIDRMAKVSAIVRAGTSSGSYSGTVTTFGNNNDDSIGWTSLSGSSTTRLAQQLQLPSSPGGCLPGLLRFIGISLILYAIAALILGMIAIGSGGGEQSVMFLAVTLIFFVPGLWLTTAAKRAKQKHDEVDVPRWQAAQAKWHRSYYCERCDVVFQAGANPDSAPIEHFQSYLYRN